MYLHFARAATRAQREKRKTSYGAGEADVVEPERRLGDHRRLPREVALRASCVGPELTNDYVGIARGVTGQVVVRSLAALTSGEAARVARRERAWQAGHSRA